MGSWSIPKRVKIDEQTRKTSPFDERVRVSRRKPDPKLCRVTKKPHAYKEIDRWEWPEVFPKTIHITKQCEDCGKKTHTHEQS